MIDLPRTERRRMVETLCAWCARFPCQCNREMPCVCGGSIDTNHAPMVAALNAHQRTPEHAAWRERNGL